MKPTDNTSQAQASLEIQIGLYWLHRLGIVSVVLGVCFLILYSFQFFTPILKLLSGYGVSVALVWIGARMADKEKQKWFGHGLTAGGWSLAYFTTYAAYFVPAVAVIKSLPLIALLLLAVAGGSLVSSLAARSEAMAIYSTCLASGSILLSNPGLLGDLSFLIIATTASILGNRKQWRTLFKFALAACYVGHLYCSLNSANAPDQTLSAVFLSAIWLVFAVGIGYAIPADDSGRRSTTILASVNAAAFAMVLFSESTIPNICQFLLMSAGSVYLAAARWLNNRTESQLQTVHSLLGLSLINCAKAMHFTGLTLVAVDVVEIATLGTLAAKYNLKSFRWFAAGLCCTLFPLWLLGAADQPAFDFAGFHCYGFVKIGFWAVLVLASLTAIYARKDLLTSPGQDLKSYSDFYYGATNLMAVLIIWQIANPCWAAFAIILQAVANGLAALKYKNNSYCLIAGSALGYGTLMLAIPRFSWITLPVLLGIISLYAAHAYGRSLELGSGTSISGLRRGFACSANLLLTLLMLKQLPADYTSAGLAIEGLVLVTAGFYLKDRFFRMSGLLVLMVVTGKLLVVDIANYNTLERILSFIAAGVVFLLASYGYARFTRAFEEDSSRADPGSETGGAAEISLTLQQPAPAGPQVPQWETPRF